MVHSWVCKHSTMLSNHNRFPFLGDSSLLTINRSPCRFNAAPMLSYKLHSHGQGGFSSVLLLKLLQNPRVHIRLHLNPSPQSKLLKGRAARLNPEIWQEKEKPVSSSCWQSVVAAGSPHWRLNAMIEQNTLNTQKASMTSMAFPIPYRCHTEGGSRIRFYS